MQPAGDGAGVGKGRQIAALAKELYRARGVKRVLWVSTSNDLRMDARRDLNDMLVLKDLPVYPRVGSWSSFDQSCIQPTCGHNPYLEDMAETSAYWPLNMVWNRCWKQRALRTLRLAVMSPALPSYALHLQ